MRNAVYILFLSLFLTINLFAQNGIEIESVSTPEFVKNGERFTLSIKLLREISESSVELYLHTGIEASLISAKLRGPSLEKQMRFYRVDAGESPFGKVYKIESGDISTSFDKIIQVNCELSASGEKPMYIYSSTSPEYFAEPIDGSKQSEIKIYKESVRAGKCLELQSQSELRLPVTLESERSSKLLIEFWSLVNEEQSKIIKIEDVLNETLVEFTLSEFGYLTTDKLLDAEYFSEFYVDPNSWNYFLIELDVNDGTLVLYINKTLYYQGIISELKGKENFILNFANDSEINSTFIDRLKIWSFKNNLQIALVNKNFNSYSADSSRVLYQNNFDAQNTIEGVTIEGSAELVNSDAPIFSQAPILNVFLYGQSYQLSWEINDLSHAQKFVVQKSYNSVDFEPVATVRVVDKIKKLYSTTDIDLTENQIIYYRVKQINKDKTVVYSSDAKVGRGKIKHFALEQNYPNPFNPVTTVSVEVKRTDDFDIIVYDIVGKTVATLHKGPLGEGVHKFNFDGTGMPSGLYLCEIKSADEIEVMKMILAK